MYCGICDQYLFLSGDIGLQRWYLLNWVENTLERSKFTVEVIVSRLSAEALTLGHGSS